VQDWLIEQPLTQPEVAVVKRPRLMRVEARANQSKLHRSV